jgi:hypothetical protein
MKTHFALSSLSSIILLLILSSCQSQENIANNTSPEGAQPAVTASNPPKPSSQAKASPSPLKPGSYCYKVDRPDLQGTAKLILTTGDKLSGDLQARISNKANGYYSSYVQQVNGSLKGNLATLDIATTIEGDKQKTQESWTMESDRLATRREIYLAAPCAEHDKNLAARRDAVAKPPEAKTPEAKPPEAKPPEAKTPEAKTPATERLSFAEGSTSANVKGGLVRGDRKIYLLTANQGQKMTLNVTSPEKNAVYDLVSPDGKVLQQETSQGSVTLPKSGDYQVILSGTRGNASYNLTVEIQ